MEENHKKSHRLHCRTQGRGGDVTFVATTKTQGREGGGRGEGGSECTS